MQPGAESILALYFSKQSIGVCQFDRPQLKISCGLLQFIIPTSEPTIHNLILASQPQLITTNNDRHPYLAPFLSRIKIIKIDERGLQDDVIENNISIFRFNPIKEHINNKPQYIAMMRQNSQACGLAKEKYRALGIMLYYLLNEYDASLANKVYINDIGYFFDEIFKHVQISGSELEVFEIIKEEVHPSLIKGKGRSKEGFSVLSLYETPLNSTGAKKILRNIFRNPTYDRTILESRLNFLTWIKNNCQDYRNLTKVFRNLHSMDTILHKFRDSRVQSQDWRKFIKTLQAIIVLHKILQQKIRITQQNQQQVPQYFTNLSTIQWPQIAKILSTVSSTLDLNQCTLQRGVDPDLDELKKTYDNLPHLLAVYARQQKWNDDYRIVFMTQLGYLVRVSHGAIEPEGDDWVLQFVKNSGKFYCNDLTAMLDNQYGDMYGQITDRQKKIYFQLENLVNQHSQTLEIAYWKLCQFECFLGISIVSNGMCCPRFSSQALIVSKGWHLLLAQDAIENNAFSFNQMQAPKQRVVNLEENIVNTNYSNRSMLITGPNGSGKTVYMKQISVIVYLAHLGFYVPAEFAEIPLVDKIVLIESKKSIYRGHNGFESEMASLSKITTPGLLSNKTFVLVDELGASIDATFAKKILTTLLLFLTQPRQSFSTPNPYLSKPDDKFKIPLCLLITHLTDIMSQSQGYIHENYRLRYLTMDMEKDQTFLFKIRPGLVRKGYGIECAKGFLGEEFVKRAYKYWDYIKYKS